MYTNTTLALAHSWWCFSVNRFFFSFVLSFLFFISFLLVKRYQKKHCFWWNLQIIAFMHTHQQTGKREIFTIPSMRQSLKKTQHTTWYRMDQRSTKKTLTGERAHDLIPFDVVFIYDFRRTGFRRRARKRSQISDDFQLPQKCKLPKSRHWYWNQMIFLIISCVIRAQS